MGSYSIETNKLEIIGNKKAATSATFFVYGARAAFTLITLLIDYNVIFPVRIIAIPQLVPPFPIVDVVGFELIFWGIFSLFFSEFSSLL